MRYEYLQPKNTTFHIPKVENIKREDYFVAYGDFLFAKDGYSEPHFENDIQALEQIFYMFNTEARPIGYKGRSMSVGDIVMIRVNDEVKTYLCDMIGWKQIELK